MKKFCQLVSVLMVAFMLLSLVSCGRNSQQDKQSDGFWAYSQGKPFEPLSVSFDENLKETVISVSDADLSQKIEHLVCTTVDLGSDVQIESVSSVYLSAEYIEEKAYNSIPNAFLGFYAEELQDLSNEAWSFSFANSEVELQVYDLERLMAYQDQLHNPADSSTAGKRIMKNLLIGGGVIIACVALTYCGVPAVACVAMSAAKGAIVGATVSTGVYAACSAITYRVSEGTWSGAGEYVLESASTGFRNGAILGAVHGAVKGIVTKANCFTEETLVLSENGPVKICDVHPGDRVLAFHEESGTYAYQAVLETTVSSSNKILKINDSLECTPEHPFLTTNGWRAAKDLMCDDYLVGPDGLAPVLSVKSSTPNDEVTVYNLTIDQSHTFVVYDGDSPVVVHNICAGYTKYFPEGSVQAQKYPAGVTYSADNIARFEPYAVDKAVFEYPTAAGVANKTCLTGVYYHDAALANAARGYLTTPAGYVWHHVEDAQTMLLVPQDVHSIVYGGAWHSGGASIIRQILSGSR